MSSSRTTLATSSGQIFQFAPSPAACPPNSVATLPGMIVLTLTFSLLTSCIIASVKPVKPNFEAL